MPLTIGVTAGDPNGIGPEVLLKALCTLPSGVRFRIYAPVEALRVWAQRWGIPFPRSQAIEWVDLPWPLRNTTRGRPSSAAGAWVYRALETACTDLEAGRIQALVTAPIMKASLQQAGVPVHDHTTYLEQRFRTRTVMSMITPHLRVAFVTAHVPLRRVADMLSVEQVVATTRIAHHTLVHWFSIPQPRIVLCAFNPHAGEHGLLGDEERHVLTPAVQQLRTEGCDVEGPFPPETAFREAREGRWDLVMALYHDQGMIPVKLLDFGRTVNFTMGLPFVRTSPDHGAAPDIAGQGIARSDGMRAAIQLAVQLAGGHRES